MDSPLYFSSVPFFSWASVKWTTAITAADFSLNRAEGGGPFRVVAGFPAPSDAYLDSHVSPGRYRYQVWATTPAGPTNPSNTVIMTVPKAGSATVVLNSPDPSVVGHEVTFTTNRAAGTYPVMTGVATAAVPTGQVSERAAVAMNRSAGGGDA